MPELPEVQTIVNDLKKKIIGRKIKDVWTDWPKYFSAKGGSASGGRLTKSEKNFRKHVIGKKIVGIERRAKNILFHLSDPLRPRSEASDHLLLIHQKLSGHFLYGKWQMADGKWTSVIKGPLLEDRNNQYIRLIFFLNNGEMLALSDLRRFAKVLCGKRAEILNLPDLKDLGPEPLDREFTFSRFKELFNPPAGGKKGRIKQVLMDPNFISGIGNIYADEILWLAKIHPLTRVENLKEKNLRIIYTSIKKILEKALKLRGSSIDDYRDTFGRRGRYDLVLYAYQRDGAPCKRCGSKIVRLKLGGRSAHFCPKCQALTHN